jgi:ABC-type branched-subunit amino acid transport system ATPase component
VLNNLRIKNFRMLEDFEVSKLGRVNLIVGKNNCGKSTVLEALRVYAGRAHPHLLQTILLEHDEFLSTARIDGIEEDESSWLAVKHLFPHREFPREDNKPIEIEADSKTLLRLDHLFYYVRAEEEKNENGESFQRRIRELVSKSDPSSNRDQPLRSTVRVSFGESSSRNEWLDLDEESPRRFSTRPYRTWRISEEMPPVRCSHIPTQFVPPEVLADLWDATTLSPNEAFVLQALQIIEPEVQGLAFVKDPNAMPRSPRTRDSRVAIVKLKSEEMPVALNSMGDGMLRILQLILAVFPARGGMLLIDEFENGLHYSVQEEVWKMIFMLAKELEIQVFATTHSLDCIQSFTKVALDSPDNGVLFKMSRSKLTSDNGKIIATVYDEESLKTVTASELEVR